MTVATVMATSIPFESTMQAQKSIKWKADKRIYTKMRTVGWIRIHITYRRMVGCDVSMSNVKRVDCAIPAYGHIEVDEESTEKKNKKIEFANKKASLV